MRDGRDHLSQGHYLYQVVAGYDPLITFFMIRSLLQMPSERSRMGLVIKDYSTLIQSSCSINIPYMKLSQIFLKEYVRQFSALVFREEVIVITCEVMHQLYIKCNQQYESVSSVLAVSSLNRHEIPLPTNRV